MTTRETETDGDDIILTSAITSTQTADSMNLNLLPELEATTEITSMITTF